MEPREPVSRERGGEAEVQKATMNKRKIPQCEKDSLLPLELVWHYLSWGSMNYPAFFPRILSQTWCLIVKLPLMGDTDYSVPFSCVLNILAYNAHKSSAKKVSLSPFSLRGI